MKFLIAILLSISTIGAASAQVIVTRAGSQASTQGPAANFTGSVRVDSLSTSNESLRASSAYVTFQPAARSAWHTHPAGQLLIVTAGSVVCKLGKGRWRRSDLETRCV
jgi:quercetin dioxygenase-like cupin family protein